MDEQVRPRVADYEAQQREGERWKVLPVVEELKAKAKAEGLWNLFMPPSHGARRSTTASSSTGPASPTSNMPSAPRRWGASAGSSEVFNCSAPDTGNMEVLHRYGTREQKERVAAAADERRDPLGFPDDRAGRRLVRRDQHPVPHRDARRRLCDQRPQMVVERGGRSALQGRDPDGQDRSGRRAPPAAVDDPRPAGRAGRDDRAPPAGVRL